MKTPEIFYNTGKTIEKVIEEIDNAEYPFIFVNDKFRICVTGPSESHVLIQCIRFPFNIGCDHKVGVIYGCGFIKLSQAKNSYTDLKFAYCPVCGAEIDWEKINEANNS